MTKDWVPPKRRNPVVSSGAGGGTRTHTELPPADFESATSTNSITPAYFTKFCRRGELQGRTREKAAFIIPQKPNNCKGHANPMCQ